jgi:pyrimidine deaminase RibD-like protein
VNDPNPLFGKGALQLKQSGIEITEGVLHEQATELNEDFFWSVSNKQAWAFLKACYDSGW